MDDIELSLVVRTTTPVTWAVEVCNSNGDGSIEIAQFSGPAAEQRAREHSIWKYGVRAPQVVAA